MSGQLKRVSEGKGWGVSPPGQSLQARQHDKQVVSEEISRSSGRQNFCLSQGQGRGAGSQGTWTLPGNLTLPGTSPAFCQAEEPGTRSVEGKPMG